MASKSSLRPIAIYDTTVKLRGMENFTSYVPTQWEFENKPFKYNDTYGVYPIHADGDLVGYAVCDSQDMGIEMEMIARYLGTVIED